MARHRHNRLTFAGASVITIGTLTVVGLGINLATPIRPKTLHEKAKASCRTAIGPNPAAIERWEVVEGIGTYVFAANVGNVGMQYIYDPGGERCRPVSNETYAAGDFTLGLTALAP